MAKLDKIAVVDVEATCWRGFPPVGQMNEIIEVGIALVDVKTLKIEKNDGFLVKPQYSEVSFFCTELTTITEEMLEKMPPFKKVCNRVMTEYGTKTRPWASYGQYDKNQFEKCCDKFNVEYPFSDIHINVKTLAAMFFGRKEMALDSLLDKMKIPLEGTHHRGGDDAFNIAKILVEILKRGR